MSQYIDVDEITKDFKTFQNSFVVFAGATGGRKIVYTGKPADVRPNIHGHWKVGFGNTWCSCSECSGNGSTNWSYCPWCGADMRGEK